MAEEQRPSSKAASKWPRVIFVDSNALYPLGPQFEHADFAELLDLRKYLGFDLLIPEVCWLEFLRQRRLEIDDYLQKSKKYQSLFRRLGLETKHFIESDKLISTFAEHLEEHFLAKAKDSGMAVIPLPGIDLKRLLKMAIERAAPFQESGEKGFRDSLILFTCMETIRRRPDLNALFITEDQRLGDALSQFSTEFETQIEVVPTFVEAVKKILTLADLRYREKLRREAAEAKDLLLKHRHEIEKKVDEIKEFSQFEIMGLSNIDLGNVEKIISLKFKDIESAVWKERNEKGGRILFTARAELTLLTSSFSWDFFNAKFQVGGDKLAPTFAPTKTVEKRIEKPLYGEASFIEKDGSLQLVELRIEKYLPTEDLVKLSRVQ